MDEFGNLDFQLNKFNETVKSFPEPEKQKILKALELAQKYHEGQKRKIGPAYIIHPVRVALILINEAGCREPYLICAALLHDVLEDTNINPQEIDSCFGARVLSLVRNLSIDREKEDFGKYMARVYKCGEDTILIKFCDRLDNARDMLSLRESEPKFVENQIHKIKTYFLPYSKENLPYFYQELLYNVSKAYGKHSR